ncbi:hypothetical protein C8R43DRAFT_1138481 [Mycena crocata]|nr:hypothetical protein C8R43DRAFT_1138481 [Mycena crocata]
MSSQDNPSIAIIGGGPGGLRVSMAAVLHKAGFSQTMFTVYEHDTDLDAHNLLGSCLDLHVESGMVSLQCKLRDGEAVPRCRVAFSTSSCGTRTMYYTPGADGLQWRTLNSIANALGRQLHGSPSPAKQENSLWKGFRVVREVFVWFARFSCGSRG